MAEDWTHVRVRRTTLDRLRAEASGYAVACESGSVKDDVRLIDNSNPAAGAVAFDVMLNIILDQRDRRRMRRILAARRARAARRRPHVLSLAEDVGLLPNASDKSDSMPTAGRAEARFFTLWEAFAAEGCADAWGGTECARILAEWRQAGRPEPVADWLAAALRASARSDGGV